jgi:hypothetical protein
MNYDSVNDAVVLCYPLSGKGTGIHVYDPAANSWSKEAPMPRDWNPTPYGIAAHSFYCPQVNVHYFYVAGDSDDKGTMWAYRYKNHK